MAQAEASTIRPTRCPRRQISSRPMAGKRAPDTSPAKPILELSRHGMRLPSISGPSRLLANRLTEEGAPLGGAEGVASEIQRAARTPPRGSKKSCRGNRAGLLALRHYRIPGLLEARQREVRRGDFGQAKFCDRFRFWRCDFLKSLPAPHRHASIGWQRRF